MSQRTYVPKVTKIGGPSGVRVVVHVHNKNTMRMKYIPTIIINTPEFYSLSIFISGLSLVLYIAEEEYVTKIGGPSGVRVVVHDKNTMPHPDEDGTLAQPGELTSIGVQKVRRIGICRL